MITEKTIQTEKFGTLTGHFQEGKLIAVTYEGPTANGNTQWNNYQESPGAWHEVWDQIVKHQTELDLNAKELDLTKWI